MADPKRKRGISPDNLPRPSPSKKAKQPCRYGDKCYRKNPDHFAEFDHPHLQPNAASPNAKSPSASLPNAVQSSAALPNPALPADADAVSSRLAAAAPFRMLLSRVDHVGDERAAVTLADLLHPALGALAASLQLTFMVDTDWLDAQYFVHDVHLRPMTLLYDNLADDARRPLRACVSAQRVSPASPFGHHHTKMAAMGYADGALRLVVSTANLVESDWQHRTQGMWVSESLPPGSTEKEGESPTGFKADLLLYLRSYPDQRNLLKPWIQRLCQADCSSINVVFVASIPGSHRGSAAAHWGHAKLRAVLRICGRGQGFAVPRDWPLVAQCSSLGSLGANAAAWLEGEMAVSAAGGGPAPPALLVYPSERNVLNSHEGVLGGACLPYSLSVHSKQRWLREHLRQWTFASRRRSRAMPHVKSYARLQPDGGACAWLLLTSANLSKAAWGRTLADKQSLQILSYEAGVLWLPHFVTKGTASEFPTSGAGAAPLPFDVPLTTYRPDDQPWTFDQLQAAFNTALGARSK